MDPRPSMQSNRHAKNPKVKLFKPTNIRLKEVQLLLPIHSQTLDPNPRQHQFVSSEKIHARWTPKKPYIHTCASAFLPGRLVKPCLHIRLPVLLEMAIRHNIVVLHHPATTATASKSILQQKEKKRPQARKRGMGLQLPSSLSARIAATDGCKRSQSDGPKPPVGIRVRVRVRVKHNNECAPCRDASSSWMWIHHPCRNLSKSIISNRRTCPSLYYPCRNLSEFIIWRLGCESSM